MRLFNFFAAALILGAVAFAACNSAEQNKGVTPGVPAPSTASAQTAQSPAPPSDNARRITPAELKDEIVKKDVVIIDVRGDAAYKQSHIKGAISIPAADILAHLDELPKDKLIATYCS